MEWTARTNWIVAHGSLQDRICLETPVSTEEETRAPSSKFPLVLKQPPSNESPCEIIVSFSHKHEISQVYVCSTSRVYEIYYALQEEDDNEYLCTVRCEAAERENCVLQTASNGEDISEEDESSQSTPQIPIQTATRNFINNSSTDEDGWVEVKVADPPSPLSTTKSTSKDAVQKAGLEIQDYYEATAEISDVYPCISVTLRLLSLQLKGQVSLDEIYIFAEPVESSDVGCNLAPAENSAGSNLLSVLVPSLLQLSSAGLNSESMRHMYGTKEKHKIQRTEPKEVRMQNAAFQEHLKMSDTKETTIQEAAKDSIGHGNLDSGSHLSHSGNMPNRDDKKKVSDDHLAKMVAQLDNRMAGIEAFCLRLEENMLKPLNSMASRMQRLEQKVDDLALRSQSPPRLKSCSRIVAPEFSYESEPDSPHVYGDAENVGSASESEKSATFDEPFSPLANALEPATFPEAAPIIAVNTGTANAEDGNDHSLFNNPEPVRKDIPSEKPSFSIDDALASALASFISSTSQPTALMSPVLRVNAPDFSDEDNENNECTSRSASASCLIAKTKGTDIIGDDFIEHSIPDISSSQGSEIEETDSPVKLVSKEEMEGDQVHMGGVQGCADTFGSLVHIPDAIMGESHIGVVSSNQPEVRSSHSAPNETAQRGQMNAACVSGNVVGNVLATSPNKFYGDDFSTLREDDATQYDSDMELSDGNSTFDGPHNEIPKSYGELLEYDYGQQRLEKELKLKSHPVLDFELPILKVNFVSQENWCVRSPLESLLCDSPEKMAVLSSLEYSSSGETDTEALGKNIEYSSKDINPFFELESLVFDRDSPCFPGEEHSDLSTCGTLEPFSSLI